MAAWRLGWLKMLSALQEAGDWAMLISYSVEAETPWGCERLKAEESERRSPNLNESHVTE